MTTKAHEKRSTARHHLLTASGCPPGLPTLSSTSGHRAPSRVPGAGRGRRASPSPGSGPGWPLLPGALGGLLLSACLSGAISDGERCVDARCPQGQLCYQDACTPICNRDDQCDPGYWCPAEFCVPGSRPGDDQGAGDSVLPGDPGPGGDQPVGGDHATGDSLAGDGSHGDNLAGGDSLTGGDQASCPPPQVLAQRLSPSDDLYAGERYLAQGSVTNPTAGCAALVSWWVCEAPSGSVWQGPACQQLASGGDLTFVPDAAGPYRLEFRAVSPGGLGSANLAPRAAADTLFIELSFADPKGIDNVLEILTIGQSCSANPQASCVPPCVWLPTYQRCWVDCGAQASAEACLDYLPNPYENQSLLCRWLDPSCVPNLDWFYACRLHSQGTCASLAHCLWDSATQRCRVDCETFTSSTCEEAGCVWVAGRGCLDSPLLSDGRQTAIAALRSDGASLGLLRLTIAAPYYRYDPNAAFGGAARIGTGLSAATRGMSATSAVPAAVFSHYYLLTANLGGDLYTSVSQALLYWEATAAGPSAPYLAPLSHLPALDLDGSSYTLREVRYPHLVADASGQQLRAVFGLQERDQNTDQLMLLKKGSHPSRADMLFYQLPLAELLLGPLGPLSARSPSALYIAQRKRSGSPALLRGARLATVSDAFPCRGDYECPATCNPGSQRCSGSVALDGYLPRLLAGGAGLVYSHLTCGSGYGTTCTSPAGTEYDLALATISSADLTRVDRLQLVAAVPGLQEIDPLLLGDLFASDTSLYYLGIEEQAIELATEGGPRTVSLPRFGVYSRSLSWTGSGWTVAPASASPAPPLLLGSHQVRSASTYYCNVNGDAATDPSERFTQDVALTNPVHLTASPDGQWLAYAMVEQASACMLANLFPGQSEIMPGAAVAADIWLVPVGSATTQRAYPEACRSLLGAVNLMPAFIAQGRQLVFRSASEAGSSYGARLFRLNLADAGGTACTLTELLDLDDATAALRAVDPSLTATGAGLEDSRTFVATASCAAAPLDLATALGIAAALGLLVGWRRRRRTAAGAGRGAAQVR